MGEPAAEAPRRPASGASARSSRARRFADRSKVPACTVSGEISGFSRAASGHCYFTLKDPAGTATLRCAMFRRAASLLDFVPSEGQQVELRGRVAVYEPRGELQFIAEAMQPAGAGALYERFLRLRARLEAEGLFEAIAKRPLPPHPKRDRRRHLARRRGAARRRHHARAPLAACAR